jgi:uncharacterized protein (TIGR02118 family)
MIKLFELLPPLPGISLQVFHDHWRHPHGSLVRHMLSVRRYAQHHRIDSASIGANPTSFEGIAEVWFDSAEEFPLLLAMPYINEHVLVDEARFIDRPNTKYFMAEEEVIVSGPQAGAHIRLKTDISGYDLEWSDNNRPNTIKLLQFIEEDGKQPWAAADDAGLTHRIGALRHVRNRPVGDQPWIGMRELSWPTVTAFERGISADPAAWAALRDRPKRSFSLLFHAERRI